jgi:hypothetical protein
VHQHITGPATAIKRLFASLQGYLVSRANMDEASARFLFQQLMLAVDHCHGKCSPEPTRE